MLMMLTICVFFVYIQTFRLDHVKSVLRPLSLPPGEPFEDILGRVLRLPSVASKRCLTNKVPGTAQCTCIVPHFLHMFLFVMLLVVNTLTLHRCNPASVLQYLINHS